MPAAKHDREIYHNPDEVFEGAEGTGSDPAAMNTAAEALRAAEIEAVDPDYSKLTSEELDSMNIDQLRRVAQAIDLPDRGTIIDRDELIAALRRCL